MANDRNTILGETIKRLLRRDAISHLKKIVNKAHAADLSVVFRSLPLEHQRKLFDLIYSIEQKAFLLSELEEYMFLDLIDHLSIDESVEIFNHMPADDVADLISKMPQEKADLILKKMNAEDSEEVEELLRYDKDTAGGIMVPDFIALREISTAREAIESIQKDYHDVEMPFYLYVVDESERLLGVVSLRQLVVVKPNTPLKDFMTRDIFSVRTDTDQEEVAKLVARYDILAVPVVDEQNRLVGIVTVDDVIDIFRREATEDILKMAGVGEDFVETQSILRSTKIRLPWLFASCLGGVLASMVIIHFEGGLKYFIYLAPFIPVITGMGGNVGAQSSTIVVRGLATGRLDVRDIWSVVSKQLTVGVLLGIIYGTFLGSVAKVRFHGEISSIVFPLVVGVSVICSMSLAALMGSLVPMIFRRIDIDPAVASGPFISTSIDVIGIFIYLSIATMLL
jgi:magnesium transporter